MKPDPNSELARRADEIRDAAKTAGTVRGLADAPKSKLNKHAKLTPEEKAYRLGVIERMRSDGAPWHEISQALGLKANGAHWFWRASTGFKGNQARSKTVVGRPQSLDEWVRKWLRYDADTGAIYVQLDDGTLKRAEYAHGGRYLRLTAARRGVMAHRCAWFLHYGEWPAGQIDHIDRNGFNNRIGNLRLASRAANASNRRSSNRTGFKGVRETPTGWVASIRKDGVQHHIGRFPTAEQAALAYDDVAVKLHGEFAATNHALGNFKVAA
jgi:hypothetical protein